jgi:wobble nucleotide-excising tRNase
VIKKIKTINNFAVFKTFNWDSDVRDNGNNIAEFKKLNLIYGRNYSGKTTLSRIIRCLETKSLHSHYQDCLFEITDNQSVINHNCLSDHQFEVRVYNSDFVYDNLSFLKNEIGEITPFAILGEQNIEIEKKIEEKEATLGSEEKKTGLRFNLHIKNEELIKKQKDKTNEETFLETTLREKAKRIKERIIFMVI